MKTFALLALAAAFSGASAQSVKLTPVAKGGMQKIGFYVPQRLALTATKPAEAKKVPQAKNAKYGVLTLAGKKHVVMLDDDNIYVDTNGNGDLTDDKPATWAGSKYGDDKSLTMYRGNAMVTMPLGGKNIPVSLGMYKFDKNDKGRPQLADTLLYYSDYALDGQLALNGKSYHVILADLMASGYKPASGDNSGIQFLIDVNNNGKFDSRGENYDATKPFNIGGTTYELKNISAKGFKVDKSKATVAEVLPPPDMSAGKKIIAFNAKTTAGDAVSFPTTYKGKLVMLDFWATWCGPCKGEIPGLSKAYDKYHPQGFEILGISLDDQNTIKALAQFTKDWNMPWPQVADGKFWQAEVAQLYAVDSIPAAFLVDGDTGEILASGDQLRGDNLVPTLEKALAKKKSGG